jgi:hypothetical protein
MFMRILFARNLKIGSKLFLRTGISSSIVVRAGRNLVLPVVQEQSLIMYRRSYVSPLVNLRNSVIKSPELDVVASSILDESKQLSNIALKSIMVERYSPIVQLKFLVRLQLVGEPLCKDLSSTSCHRIVNCTKMISRFGSKKDKHLLFSKGSDYLEGFFGEKIHDPFTYKQGFCEYLEETLYGQSIKNFLPGDRYILKGNLANVRDYSGNFAYGQTKPDFYIEDTLTGVRIYVDLKHLVDISRAKSGMIMYSTVLGENYFSIDDQHKYYIESLNNISGLVDRNQLNFNSSQRDLILKEIDTFKGHFKESSSDVLLTPEEFSFKCASVHLVYRVGLMNVGLNQFENRALDFSTPVSTLGKFSGMNELKEDLLNSKDLSEFDSEVVSQLKKMDLKGEDINKKLTYFGDILLSKQSNWGCSISRENISEMCKLLEL